ncbi:hypothetical protein BH20VER1_BH20VER1_12600 [soil metagenome]
MRSCFSHLAAVNRLLAALAAAALLGFVGCATEGPTPEEVGEQFRRGAAGEGQLGPIDRSNDPYVRPREGAPVGSGTQ